MAHCQVPAQYKTHWYFASAPVLANRTVVERSSLCSGFSCSRRWLRHFVENVDFWGIY